MTRYDTVVVGAGPAGCAAAIFCAQQGLRVALLESSTVCRDRPGETLPPHLPTLLAQLGVADGLLRGDFVRHAGNWVQWGGKPFFNAFGGEPDEPWRGFQVPRRELNRLLLARAHACGVVVIRPCHVVDVIHKGQAVIGVETDKGPVHGAYVIDGSGAHGWLARRLALATPAFSPRLLARYGYARGATAICDEAPRIIADQHGWCWIARIGAGTYAWTRLDFDSHQTQPPQPPSAFRHLHHLPRIRGADVTWRACRQCAGPGYFMVGDAASVLDPGSSRGVLKAIMSGMMAADTVVSCLDHPARVSAIQFQYRQWLNHWFVRDMHQMRELYAAHPAPPAWLAGVPIFPIDTQDVSSI